MSCLIRIALSLLLLFAATQHLRAQQPSQQPSERERGIELYRTGKIDHARAALRNAVKANKADWEAWYYLGLVQIRQKGLKDASKSFETSLTLHPQFGAGHAGLAYALFLRNKLPDAIKAAEAALNLDATIPDAHYVLAVARFRMGNREAALAEVNALIKLKADFGPVYLLKSQILLNTGDSLWRTEGERIATRNRYSEAADALEKYLQLTPNAEFKESWTEQLESLRLFAALPAKDDPNRMVSSAEVTTKARVLSKPEPTYTETARQHAVEGTVILRCVFRGDGKIAHLFVVSGLPDGLTERAIAAARLIKFVPAMIDGKPVSMWMELQYNFNLY